MSAFLLLLKFEFGHEHIQSSAYRDDISFKHVMAHAYHCVDKIDVNNALVV